VSLEQIIEAIRDLGVSIATAVGLAYFVYKAVWPFVIKQVEDSKEAREHERGQFLAALERRDAEFAKMVTALNELAIAVRQIEARVRSSDR
jgi:hypothetical protein